MTLPNETRSAVPLAITVLLCTRRRPEMLRGCLEAIAAQRRAEDFTYRVIVVENDEAAQCREIVAGFAGALDIRHVLETGIGISLARNRALDEALADAPDWVAFTDDDEVPARDWLSGFVQAVRKFPEAEAFMGARIKGVAPAPPSKWLPPVTSQQTGTGTYARNIATANAFIRRDVIAPEGRNMRLMVEFGLTGESDTEFFTRLRRAGGQVLFVAEARVTGADQPERAGFAFHYARQKRQARNLARIRVLHSGRWIGAGLNLSRLMRDILQMGAAGVLGALLWPFKREEGTRWLAYALARSARVQGTVLYFIGGRLEPYRKIDGQ